VHPGAAVQVLDKNDATMIDPAQHGFGAPLASYGFEGFLKTSAHASPNCPPIRGKIRNDRLACICRHLTVTYRNCPSSQNLRHKERRFNGADNEKDKPKFFVGTLCKARGGIKQGLGRIKRVAACCEKTA